MLLLDWSKRNNTRRWRSVSWRDSSGRHLSHRRQLGSELLFLRCCLVYFPSINRLILNEKIKLCLFFWLGIDVQFLVTPWELVVILNWSLSFASSFVSAEQHILLFLGTYFAIERDLANSDRHESGRCLCFSIDGKQCNNEYQSTLVILSPANRPRLPERTDRIPRASCHGHERCQRTACQWFSPVNSSLDPCQSIWLTSSFLCLS